MSTTETNRIIREHKPPYPYGAQPVLKEYKCPVMSRLIERLNDDGVQGDDVQDALYCAILDFYNETKRDDQPVLSYCGHDDADYVMTFDQVAMLVRSCLDHFLSAQERAELGIYCL